MQGHELSPAAYGCSLLQLIHRDGAAVAHGLLAAATATHPPIAQSYPSAPCTPFQTPMALSNSSNLKCSGGSISSSTESKNGSIKADSQAKNDSSARFIKHLLQCQPFCTWQQQEAFLSNWKMITKPINKITAAKKDKRIPLALIATDVCIARWLRSIYQSGSEKQKSTISISLGR